MTRVILESGHFFDTEEDGVQEWEGEPDKYGRPRSLYITAKGHIVFVTHDDDPELTNAMHFDATEAAHWFIANEMEDEAPELLKESIERLRL